MPTKFYALWDRQMLIHEDGTQLTAEDLDILKSLNPTAEYFTEDSTGIAVLHLPKETVLPQSTEPEVPTATANSSLLTLHSSLLWAQIREQFDTLGYDSCFHLARAKALAEWRANSRFCPRCGARMLEHTTLTARECPECRNLVFPRIEPCIIVLVSRGDEILLARHVQRNQNIYACIAGFMEAGETAEQAVAREIMEETGISVRNIRYYGSQSWPFPSQLMFGFTAEYESGEIKLQEDELSDAQWFHRDDCPASPPPGSIAYRLIHNT